MIRRLIFWAILFGGVVVITHVSLYPILPGFIEPDAAWNMMEADRFKAFEFPAFYHGIWYGGNLLGPLRALWTSFWVWPIGGLDVYQSAHLSFSFGFLSWAMAWVSAILVFYYSGFCGATVVGAFIAIGFRHWLDHWVYDWHVAVYLLCCIFLILKLKFLNPFLQASNAWLLGLAILTGISIYTGRTSLLYVLVFWLPDLEVKGICSAFIHEKNLFLKAVRIAAICFLVLFLYLWIFGPNLGIWKGRPVKLLADPNLSIAFVLMALWATKQIWAWSSNRRGMIIRVSVCLFGLLIGFSPELIHAFRTGKGVELSGWGTNDFSSAMVILGHLPFALRELIAGGQALTRVFPIVLCLWAFWILIKKMEQDPKRYRPLGWIAVLCVYSYIRVKTFSPGAYRYLFSMAPIVAVALGLLTETIYQSRRIWKGLVLILLLVGTLVDQLEAQRELIDGLQRSNSLEQMKSVNQVFLDQKIDTVLSDDYGASNNYTFLASKKVAYIYPGNLVPLFTAERYKDETRVGILLKQTSSKNGTVEMDHRQWKIQFLKKIGPYHLFAGQRS